MQAREHAHCHCEDPDLAGDEAIRGPGRRARLLHLRLAMTDVSTTVSLRGIRCRSNPRGEGTKGNIASLRASARSDIQNAHFLALIADSLSRYYARPMVIICDIILAFS